MSHFSIVFNTHHPPRCPFCQRDLLPTATIVLHGLAVCHECADLSNVLPLAALRDAMQDPLVEHVATVSNGVSFFNPPPATRRDSTYPIHLALNHYAAKARVNAGNTRSIPHKPTPDTVQPNSQTPTPEHQPSERGTP